MIFDVFVKAPCHLIGRWTRGPKPWPPTAGPSGLTWYHTLNWQLSFLYIRQSGPLASQTRSRRVYRSPNLNVPAWERHLAKLGGRENVLDFVKFGFPTGYVGPTSDTRNTPNHPSASNFPQHIEELIHKEIGLKGVVGPFPEPPFSPWCHVSPLMSREKGDSGKRRVITDMTYPAASSINAYIVKNGVYGFEHPHSLPTVEALADSLRGRGTGTYLSTIDVSRAYKNFVSDPLDWPLLCFAWGGLLL